MDDLQPLFERIRALSPDGLASLRSFVAKLEGKAADAGGSQPPDAGRSNAGAQRSIDWPHAPPHRLGDCGTFLVTAGTYGKEHHFVGAARLDLLHETLLNLARKHGWRLEAWAVFSNHYHFLGHAEAGADSLSNFLGQLHRLTAAAINDADGKPRRKVWHNFWETRLTFERSYLARLNYVHQNAVWHGLVRVANQYRWCSAAWFERMATRAQVRTIYSFKIDRLRVLDDFDVAPPT